MLHLLRLLGLFVPFYTLISDLQKFPPHRFTSEHLVWVEHFSCLKQIIILSLSEQKVKYLLKLVKQSILLRDRYKVVQKRLVPKHDREIYCVQLSNLDIRDLKSTVIILILPEELKALICVLLHQNVNRLLEERVKMNLS